MNRTVITAMTIITSLFMYMALYDMGYRGRAVALAFIVGLAFNWIMELDVKESRERR